jgi:hypothetical protein
MEKKCLLCLLLVMLLHFFDVCLLYKLFVCFDSFEQFCVFLSGFCVRHVIFYTSKQVNKLTNLQDEEPLLVFFVVLAFLARTM